MKSIFTFLFTTIALFAVAQVDDDEIQFESETYDFGIIKFGDQKINATYIFTNNSPIDFQIRDVKASCGCTVPSWPEHPIKPGQKGIITATFDPTHLAGEVDKSIEIFANYSVIMSKILTLKGIIKEPVEQDLSKVYPGQFGYIRQSKNTIALGEIVNSGTYTDTVLFVNEYNLPLKFTGVLRKPDFLTYEMPQETLKPGESVAVVIHMDASKVGDYGLVNTEIVFKTNDKSFPLKAVKLAFFIMRDFSKMSKKERKNAPKLKISGTEFDFGTMQEGATGSRQVKISNAGKSTLKILKVETHCGCTTIDLTESELQPNESKTILLKFDSMFVSGQAQKEVTLYTNDPDNHFVKLYVSAKVLAN